MLRAFSIWVLCLAVVGCGDDKASTAPSAVAEDAGVDAASEGSDAAMPPGDTGGEEPDVSSSDPDVAAPPSDTVGSNQETSAPGETCSEDLLEACQYSPGSYEIDDVESVLGQKVYARELPLLIRFPTDAEGPRPVVIVSHGGTFSTDGHKELMKPWGKALAQAGYIAIHLAHTPFDMDKMPQLCEQQGILPADCDPEAVNPAWVVRPADASAIIDELPTLSSQLLNNKGVEMDVTRVASLGWSGGSQVPAALAGATRKLTESVSISSADPRVLTGIVLSPQGPGFAGYYEDESGSSMDTVDRPLFVSTGDNDLKPSNDTLLPSIRRETFENLPEGGGHRLLYSLLPVGVGGHGTYQLVDQGSSDEQLDRLTQALVSGVLAHLDQHLRDTAEAAAYLESSKVSVLAGADLVEWVSK